MMPKRFLKPFGLVILAALIGIGIGLLRIERQKRRLSLRAQSNLKILSLRGILSPELRELFEKSSGSKISLTEVENSEDILPQLSESAFDAVILFENQISQAVQSGLIQSGGVLANSFLQDLANVPTDFSDFSGRPNSKNVLPILWGVTGYAQLSAATAEAPSCTLWVAWLQNAKAERSRVLGLPNSTREIEHLADCASARTGGGPTVFSSSNAELNHWATRIQLSASELSAAEFTNTATPPQFVVTSHGSMAFAPLKEWKFSTRSDESELWILEVALTTATKNQKAVTEFFDFLSSHEASRMLIDFTHQASPNRLVEKDELDPRLKPSYLRQIPLTQYHLRPESPRAGEIRKYLQAVQRKASDKR